MTKQAAQSVDDRKPKAQSGAAVALPFAETIKFPKYFLVLVGRNSHARIPNLDPHIADAPPATDDDPTTARITHGVRNEIEDDTLQQHEIAAQPHAALGDTKR